MKIFSLESKTGLVAWSVVLGFLVNAVVYFTTRHVDILGGFSSSDLSPVNVTSFGLPFHYYTTGTDLSHLFYPFNLLFWILVVFIILFIIRYFRKKHYQISSKLN
jgi:hypothetical protein